MKGRARDRLVGLASIAATIWLYWWTIASAGGLSPPSRTPAPADYYNHLVAGWVAGHLYMDLEPSPRLAQLKDPYDPRENEPCRLTDASYYNGHYYLYFGPTPAATLLLPFRLVTGRYLPAPWAILILCSVGFTAAAGVWLALKERYFAGLPAWTAAIGVFIIGIGSMAAVLLRRPFFWELAGAGGFAFSMLALAALYRAIHDDWPGCARGGSDDRFGRSAGGRGPQAFLPPARILPERTAAAKRPPAGWMLLAGLFLGLAAASRPTYVFAAPVLAIPLAGAAQAAGLTRSRRRMALAAFAGFVAVSVVVLAYDYARFGNPLETGHNYLLSVAYESKVPLFRLRYLLFNLRMYYLLPGHWSWLPPFVSPLPLPRSAMPARFYTVDDPYGLLPIFPVALLALAAPAALIGRAGLERIRLRTILLCTAGLYLLVGTVVLLYVATIPRYAVDFLPALMLLVATGFLSLIRLARAPDKARGAAGPSAPRTGQGRLRPAKFGIASGLVAAVAIASLATGAVAILDLGNVLGRVHPGLVRRVVAVTGRLEAMEDTLRGVHYGPLEIRVRFPSRPGSRVQTLVRSGDPATPDRVLVDYRSPGRIRFGVRHADATPVWSRSVDFDPSGVHKLRLELGSFYPPLEHRFFAGAGYEKSTWLRHRAAVVWDGTELLRTFAPFSPSRRGAPPTTDSDFSGTVVGIHTLNADLQSRRIDAPHNLRFTFSLPVDSVGRRFPILATGRVGAGDDLFVESGDASHGKLGYRHGTGATIWSRTFESAAGRVHEIEIRQTETGWAGPPRGERHLVVWIDDALVWDRYAPAAQRAPDDLVTGRYPGGHGIAPEFPSRVQAFARPLHARIGGPLLLRVMFPAARKGDWQPILSIGRPGAADTLSAYWVSIDAVQFRFDHWAAPLLVSRTAMVDERSGHDLEIFLPSFDPDHFGTASEGTIWLRLDGKELLRAHSSAFGFAPDRVAFGRNAAGATFVDPYFHGAIVKRDWLGE